MKNSLKLDWCSHQAAKHACLKYHYAKAVPAGKLVKIGVWEEGNFKGAIIYGRSANYNLSKPYGLKNTEVCELVRVALKDHKNPVTRMVAILLKMLKKHCPGIKVVVSYADKNQGHEGTIYKAGNWKMEAISLAEHYFLCGKLIHSKSVSAKYGTRSISWLQKNVDPNVRTIKSKGKIRFSYRLR